MSVWNGQYFLQNPAASVRLPLVEDALCAVEYGRIVQCDDAAVGPRFKVYTHGIAALEMASAEVIPHYLYIHSQFRTVSTSIPNSSAMRCELPLGNLSLIRRNSLKVIVIAIWFYVKYTSNDLKITKNSGLKK